MGKHISTGLVLFVLAQMMFGQPVYTKEYLMGKFDYTKDTSFELVPAKYSKMANQYLRNEAMQSFIKMAEAAKKDSIKLYVLSATRSFDEQKQIWNDKWTGRTLVNGQNLTHIKDSLLRAKEILKYSSMPSASRHHWGTDVDLDNFNNAYFKHDEGLKIYNWLLNNASKYGFCNPYNEKGIARKSGYEEERWHWSYLPIAKECLKQYKTKVTYKDINGFHGQATAKDIGIIENYLFGINNNCE
ncbi:MAG: M15 family metallopeptidase [Bacteroidota bacterium]